MRSLLLVSPPRRLESYLYNLLNSHNDEKLVGKFEAADKAKLESADNGMISWLDRSCASGQKKRDDALGAAKQRGVPWNTRTRRTRTQEDARRGGGSALSDVVAARHRSRRPAAAPRPRTRR